MAIKWGDKGNCCPDCPNQDLTAMNSQLLYWAMLEGKCPKCGVHYTGWALRNPRYQSCTYCGAALEITEDGRRVSPGYSPFTAIYCVFPANFAYPKTAAADKIATPKILPGQTKKRATLLLTKILGYVTIQYDAKHRDIIGNKGD